MHSLSAPRRRRTIAASRGQVRGKRPFPVLVLALLLLLAGPLAARAFDHVILDPGHGGKDNGSLWYGVAEKKLTLDLAERIEKILKDKGISTVLTRRKDVFVPLEDRAAISNRYRNAILVSLHFNAHTDRSIRGIETFYFPNSSRGKRLAGLIQGELSRRINTVDRGIKPAKLKVLRLSRHPSVLVECSFLSNRWECQRCAAAWYRQILAEEIVEGILKFR